MLRRYCEEGCRRGSRLLPGCRTLGRVLFRTQNEALAMSNTLQCYATVLWEVVREFWLGALVFWAVVRVFCVVTAVLWVYRGANVFGVVNRV